jgi:hypothetical protein
MKQPTLELIEHGLRGNSIDGLVEGWTFRIQEVSSNVYKIDGWDSKENHVSGVGTNPIRVLEKCMEETRHINPTKGLIANLGSVLRKIFGRAR